MCMRIDNDSLFHIVVNLLSQQTVPTSTSALYRDVIIRLPPRQSLPPSRDLEHPPKVRLGMHAGDLPFLDGEKKIHQHRQTCRVDEALLGSRCVAYQAGTICYPSAR
jgi:hypothetical protein